MSRSKWRPPLLKEGKLLTQALIQSKGCYLGVFDLGSPANRYGTFDSFLGRATQEAETHGQGHAALLYFNGYWADLARTGMLYAWTILFDGVYKVKIEIINGGRAVTGTTEAGNGFIGQSLSPLVCPTGHITVASLSDLGNPSLRPLVTVAPGTYRATLEVDGEQESKHSFLNGIDQYPLPDGPDWHLRLARA